jgi:hypothetical protein
VHRSDHGTNRNGEEGTAVALGVYRTQPIIPVNWTGADYVGLSHTFTDGDWGGTGKEAWLFPKETMKQR